MSTKIERPQGEDSSAFTAQGNPISPPDTLTGEWIESYKQT